MVARKWLRSGQWHFLLKVRQDGAPQQSVLAVFNTPENKQWQMSNKERNSGNLCSKNIHQSRKGCKGGYKDRQRGEKKDMKKPQLFYTY